MISPITRPMLAVDVGDVSNITFPIIAQPKIDGIRCLKVNGKVVSRNFKPIPNHYIREYLEHILPEGADGEIVGENIADFQATVSAVMSYEGQPEFYYYAFDYVPASLEIPYEKRVEALADWCLENGTDAIRFVESRVVHNIQELRDFEEDCLEDGYEGVILRNPRGTYKCGRSTVRQQFLLKLKRFKDSEAVVEGFEPLMHNENASESNAFGLSERSTKKDGLVALETLGALLVRDTETNITFKIGTGFDAATRETIWRNQDNYLGELVKYKYFEIGVKDAPRFPVFLGFRHKNDMD